MKAQKQPRFDVKALRELAGNKVFSRAEAYFHAGQVEILSIEPDRVAGTQEYRTILTGTGEKIGGECSCPAFNNWGFCKHMTATALAANETGGNDDTSGDSLSRIRKHLKSMSIDALVRMIMELAENDLQLFRRLDMAATALDADDKTLQKRLRKALDDAMRTRGYIDYADAPDWAAGVAAVLDIIADLIRSDHAEMALGLCEHAITDIERALEDIDDSDGYCGGLLDQAQEIHLAACRAAHPDPIALAGNLFAREMAGNYDTFYNAAQRYGDVLGEEGLGEYRRLAAIAWEKLPARTGDARKPYEYASDYGTLASILDFFAERDNDVEARIALRAKDLSSPWKYLQLAEFCNLQGLPAQALHYAEEGLWVFEDGHPDERLIFFAVELMLADNRKEDACKQLWRAFEQRPSLELYERLARLEGKTAVERAIELLEKRMGETSTAASRFPWSSSSELLIGILMKERMLDAAWTCVREYGASEQLKQALARASEATHPCDALNVYAERVEKLVNSGGNSSYAEASSLVARMGETRDATEQEAYVDDLKTRHRRKRNFMKLIG